jgi:sulfite reductase (NADPH) flavoprotein alpha-component
MTTLKTNNFPFDSKQDQLIEQLLKSLDLPRLYWLHGYIQSQIQSRQGNNGIPGADTPDQQKINGTAHPGQKLMPEITVLFGTHTGNSRKIAARLAQQLEQAGYFVRLKDISEYKARDIKSEKYLFLIISTHGEGQPPLAAEDFYEYILSKHNSPLRDLSYSVLALGDKSYFNFCKTGTEIDSRLLELEARRIVPRVDCDVNYTENADSWVNGILQSLKPLSAEISVVPTPLHLGLTTNLPASDSPIEAVVFDKIKLNGRGSEKNTFHFELQLLSDGIQYLPGDSLSIVAVNSPEQVTEMIGLLHDDPEKPVSFNQSSDSLSNILGNEVELTKITRENLEKYALLAGNSELKTIVADPTQLSSFLYGNTWPDILCAYPGKITAEDFLSIARPIQPRLYSISSSVKAYPGEVHITVSQLSYNLKGKIHKGICSTYLTEFLEPHHKLKVSFATNEGFRLPSDNSDMIMIGPGTGVAPFRAFMQEREHTGASGKNWLFFGSWCFSHDFLYQTEWQAWYKKSILNRIDLAFSRDQKQKIYVQHRMLEKSRDVYDWLENGAKIYVCGDMKKMAPDVNKTFVEIIKKEGGISLEKAQEYVKSLRKEKRYFEDVY